MLVSCKSMAMVASVSIHTILQSPLRSSTFSSSRKFPPAHLSHFTPPSAKLQLSKLMGGRGLCGGEQGLQQELKRPVGETSTPIPQTQPSAPSPSIDTGDDAFEKELQGLTGGFPGGEKGLKRFVEQNPPPEKKSSGGEGEMGLVLPGSKPNPPELPLLMPGMIVIVKNPANPFHMFTGIVQRVTDGNAGVLFEGGNWDKLLTFRLDELERREKGPPMVSPKSAVLESLADKSA